MVSQAKENVESEPQKIYVEPSQLGFTGGEIFANINGEWTPLEAIYSDASGLLAAVKKNPYHGRWTCISCGYSNDPWEKLCQNWIVNQFCLTPRP